MIPDFFKADGLLPDAMRFVCSGTKKHYRRLIIHKTSDFRIWQIIIPDENSFTLYHGYWPDAEFRNFDSCVLYADEMARQFLSLEEGEEDLISVTDNKE